METDIEEVIYKYKLEQLQYEICYAEWSEAEKAIEQYNKIMRDRMQHKKNKLDYESVMRQAGIYSYPLYMSQKCINGMYINKNKLWNYNNM